MPNVLDEWFGPRPVHEGLVREALNGALEVTIHPYRARHRVMVRKRGQRFSRPVQPWTAEELLRAQEEGKLMRLMPRRGKNPAQLRILTRPVLWMAGLLRPHGQKLGAHS
jgi:hypothetical protein